ncbi:MAG: Gfo/Idh/MocA family oxidoreductase [Firmicutes bacterium]|nr:Gfo/Idh/MocA family oxidoreductase [Bacillota bacterium]
MITRIGVAVVGCGMIGQFHLEAMKNLPEFEVIGVWDANPSLAAEVAQKWNIRPFCSFEEIINDQKVGMVDICLPSGLHGKYGVEAAKAGKHVMVEKPIDITIEAAKQLVDACKSSEVFLATILQNRFSPSVAKVKDALNKDVLGRLLYGEATIKWYRPKEYYTARLSRGTLQYDGGGALMNQGIHTIDLLLWFMGDVKHTRSLVKTSLHPIELEDLGVAIVEFESGAIGTIIGSTAMKPGFPESIELYGEKGSIALEAGRIIRWKVDGTEEGPHLDGVPVGSGSSDPGGIPIENHIAQFRAVAQAILANEQPPVSGEEAIKPLQLILDIYHMSGK